MWLYNNKVIKGIEQMPKNTFGFIYEATYIPTNEKYLGKKVLYFNRTLPPLKGFKRKRKVVKESDWLTYYGSHEKIKTLLKENIVAIKIKGSCAFHSSLQNNIKNDILESTKNISYNTPKIQLISTVTGFIADNEDFVEDYWWKNIRNVVKFSESIEQCIDTDIFIEISPHTVLSSSIQQHYPEKIILQSGNRKEDSACRFLSSLSKLYFTGADLDMTRFGKKNNQYFPKYEWKRETFIKQSVVTQNRIYGKVTPLDRISFTSEKFPYVKDHVVGNKIILPTVCYIDLIHKYLLKNNNTIENFKIHSMYEVNNMIEFDVKKNNNKIILTDPVNNTNYLSFNLNNLINIPDNTVDFKKNLSSKIIIDEKNLINILTNKNFNFGTNMFNFDQAYILNNSILTSIKDTSPKNYHTNPTIIDIALTNVMFIQGITNNNQYLPTEIGSILYYNNNNVPKYIYTVNNVETSTFCDSESYIIDEDFNIIIKMSNLLSKNISSNNTCIYSINTVKNTDNYIDKNPSKTSLADTDSDPDTDMDTDLNTHLNTDSDVNTDANTGADANAVADRVANTNMHTHSNVVANTNAVTDTVAGTDINIDSNANNIDLEYEFITCNKLLKIRDILSVNIRKLYLIDISNHYEIVGFIRSLMNESKIINYKICYYESLTNLEERLKKYTFQGIETFYKKNEFYEHKLEKIVNHEILLDNYYLDYSKKGSINNLEFRGNYINEF